MSRKEYIEVVSGFSSYGLILTDLIWKNQKNYSIDRVLHTCRCRDDGKLVTRHTVLIGGKQKYIFQEDESKWYVKVD